MSSLLILRNVRVENANSMAGLTYGFPAITQFLGFTHALSRKLEPLHGISLHETAVIAHSVDVLASGQREKAMHLTRNPLLKNGDMPPFNEEGRMHMAISLVIRIHGTIKNVDAGAAAVAATVKQVVPTMRLAAGRVNDVGDVRVISEPTGKKLRGLLYSLLPGFMLVATDLDDEEPLVSFINAAALRYEAGEPNEKGRAEWERVQCAPGYRVPLCVGYRAISPVYAPGTVEESRAQHNPFAFVEPIHAVGEWKSPHRIHDLNEVLWRYETAPGYYLCRTAPAVAPAATEYDFSNLFNFEESE